MSTEQIGYLLSWVGTGAWGVCFWWMHRISSRQDALLAELKDQARRIEELTQMEHDILREVHPEVGEIRETMEEVSQDLMDVRRDSVGQVLAAQEVFERINKLEEHLLEAEENRASEKAPENNENKAEPAVKKADTVMSDAPEKTAAAKKADAAANPPATEAPPDALPTSADPAAARRRGSGTALLGNFVRRLLFRDTSVRP